MATTHEPLACALKVTDAAAQSLEWDDIKSHMRTVERVEGGIAMTFDRSLASEIDDLAEREQACCGFLTITTSVSGDEVRLVVTTQNPDAMPLIESIAGTTS